MSFDCLYEEVSAKFGNKVQESIYEITKGIL